MVYEKLRTDVVEKIFKWKYTLLTGVDQDIEIKSTVGTYEWYD